MKKIIQNFSEAKMLLSKSNLSFNSLIKSIVCGVFFSCFIMLVPLMILINLLIFLRYITITIIMIVIVLVLWYAIYFIYYYKTIQTYNEDLKELKISSLVIVNTCFFALIFIPISLFFIILILRGV